MHDIAKALENAEEIILAGHGDEAERFKEFLMKRNKAVADKIIDAINVDTLTILQIFLKALEMNLKEDYLLNKQWRYCLRSMNRYSSS